MPIHTTMTGSGFRTPETMELILQAPPDLWAETEGAERSEVKDQTQFRSSVAGESGLSIPQMLGPPSAGGSNALPFSKIESKLGHRGAEMAKKRAQDEAKLAKDEGAALANQRL